MTDMQTQTPWGTIVHDDALSLIRVSRAQLMDLYARGATPNAAATRSDLLGFDRILVSGRAENANAFLDAKREDRMAGGRKTNLEIVSGLQIMGRWL